MWIPTQRNNESITMTDATHTHTDTIDEIDIWFTAALKPTASIDDRLRVQLGVHFEECAELANAVGIPMASIFLQVLATELKTGKLQLPTKVANMPTEQRAEILDALCDGMVTSIGVANIMNMDIGRALGEVNASNWSKEVEPGIFDHDANGKIIKGPDFFKPDLRKFV